LNRLQISQENTLKSFLWLSEQADTGKQLSVHLKITGLRKYFDIIVTANDVDNFKPHPETFTKCAELMKVDPAFIEVFEDGDLRFYIGLRKWQG